MKVIRILIYEGPREWLSRTLTSDSRYVKGVREFQNGAKIREQFLTISSYAALQYADVEAQVEDQVEDKKEKKEAFVCGACGSSSAIPESQQ